jgi:hypothetical protein
MAHGGYTIPFPMVVHLYAHARFIIMIMWTRTCLPDYS